MKLHHLVAIAAGAMLLFTVDANAASLLKCGSGPLDIHDCPAGPAGADGKDGLNGKDGADSTIAGPKGEKGDQGIAGRDGTAFDADDTLALSAALSPPVWLGDNETFRISAGVGFNESAAAIGATGLVRIDGALAGFLGGAVSTESGAWAGKAGLSFGF